MSVQSASLVVASSPERRAVAGAHTRVSPLGRAFLAYRRNVLAALLAVAAIIAIALGTQELTTPGKIALGVLLLSIIGWAITELPDTAVGLAAAVALGSTGVLDKDALFHSLGHEFIWFLLSALVIAAFLQRSGLVDRAVEHATRGVGTVRQLFLVLTFAVAATAFVIPSTSARAALFLPVFLSMATRFDDAGIRRGLGLLFPTVILLSAGGSLIGAGAHVFAADFISRTTGKTVDFMGWALAAMPFAIGTSVLACVLILRLFVDPSSQRLRLAARPAPAATLDARQRMLGMAILVIVGLWSTTALHGISMAMIGMGGVALLLFTRLVEMKSKDAFKSVDLDLVLFLATTFALIEALSRHGVDRWMADGVIAALPAALRQSTIAVVAFVAFISLASHLVITSRSARASVLIPAVAMPFVAMGHDPELLIMVTIMGTGFCQTLPASAKPVALFSNIEQASFSVADLKRLSLHLMPIMFVSLVGYAILVWGR